MEAHRIKKELLQESILLQIPVLQGEALAFLHSLVTPQTQRILEIGSANAKTSIELALDHPQLQVVTIERDEAMQALARKNIEKAHLQSRVSLIGQDALDARVDGLFDGIFIDGAKSKYLEFFERYAPNLSEDGWILVDNLDFHGLVDHPERTHNRHTKALIKKIAAFKKFLQEHEEYETTWISAGDGMALIRRKRS